MESIILDSTFEKDFKAIFNGRKVSAEELSSYVTDVLIEEADKINYLEIINTLKTCHVIGEPYKAFKVRAYNCVKPFDGRDKFLLALTLLSISNLDSPIADDYLVSHSDPLMRAVKRSYEKAGLSTERSMVSPQEIKFDEDVGTMVNSWDEYFYNVCKQVARNSKCFSRQIGAIVVIDKSIISTGYNGPPRGVPTCDRRWRIDNLFREKYGSHIKEDTDITGRCPRHIIGFKSGEGLDVCVAGHAERNSLINAARNGIATKGATMYMTCGIPCSPCLVEIINAGIKEIVVTNFNFYDELNSNYLLATSDLKVRVFDFIIKNN